MTVPDNRTIDAAVRAAVSDFAQALEGKHMGQHKDPNGIINRKIHNVFIEALGIETQYYTALVRSLDSSLGNMIEKLALSLATLTFDSANEITGPLVTEESAQINDLIDQYEQGIRQPEASDYTAIPSYPSTAGDQRTYKVDYLLTNRTSQHHYLIELKIGGDLDSKKAKIEKRDLLLRYITLVNSLPPDTPVTVYFATAYNRYGDNKPWPQPSVRRYFADSELLIGRDFWNFVTDSNDGYEMVLESYQRHSVMIRKALETIRVAYLEEPSK